MLEEDMEELYEQAPCGYLSTLPDGTLIKANATLLEWTGYARDALLAKKRFQNLLSISGQIFYDTHYAPLLQMQGYVKELAFDLICADGQRMPVLLNSKLKRDANGDPLLIRTTLLDARGRRAYEKELLSARRHAEDAEATVRMLNARLEELLAARTAERDRLWRISQDILAFASVEGYFISCNPAFTALLGWTEEELKSMPFTALAHPDEVQDMLDTLEELKAGKLVIQKQVRRRHKDGSYRWISWNIVPENGLLYMVGRDVTEKRKQAEALKQTEDALRQARKMEAVGQLTGGIAHDFNNMLAAVVGNLQLMRMRLEQNRIPDLRRYIDVAESVTDRATAMVQRLLAFSRRQALDPKQVDMNALVLSMHELIRTTVGPAIQVQTMLADHLPPVLCDQNQLESALLNLAINARDAMPQGGTLTIETAQLKLDEVREADAIGVAPGQYVAVRVIDTGTGMAPDIIERAFDPFFTTKPIGQGTGLGLSMTYGFVRQSGGQVRIESIVNKGTTVSLYLPAHLGEAADTVAQSKPGLMVSAEARATILLVDDEESLRHLLAEMLAELGHTVVQAGDGPQALTILQSMQQPVDLLVSDVGLPGGMNGKQLCDAARLIYPGLKAMLITGYADRAMAGNQLEGSGIEVMIKPFGLNKFVERVHALLKAEPPVGDNGR